METSEIRSDAPISLPLKSKVAEEVLRDLFYLPPNVSYLLNHSVGCLPIQTAQASHGFFSLWADQAGLSWPRWLAHLQGFKESLGELIGARAAEISPQVNISSAVTKLLFSLPIRSGRKKLLISKLDFPSVGFVLAQGSALGYELEIIEPVNLSLSAGHWISKLNDSVQLLVISHCTFGSSTQNSVAEICRAARSRGIYTLVDVAQSIGVLPIHVSQWECDFVVGSCVKWLCGGPGAGFLWADSARVSELKPRDVGWFSHKSPFEFDMAHFDYAETMDRFQGGTPSILPFLIATESLKVILDIGVAKIRSHNIELTEQVKSSALSLEWNVISPQSCKDRGGTLCLSSESCNLEQVEQRLKAAGVIVDFRPGYGIRISPHIYNTSEDILKLLDELKNFR